MPGRFESLHLTLSPSRGPMRVLGPIIQKSALSVLDVWKQLPLSDAIALQLIGYASALHGVPHIRIELSSKLDHSENPLSTGTFVKWSRGVARSL